MRLNRPLYMGGLGCLSSLTETKGGDHLLLAWSCRAAYQVTLQEARGTSTLPTTPALKPATG